MTTQQLTLDLFGAHARADAWHTTHQVGQYRTPWTWCTGSNPDEPTPQKGDLLPAWRCCHCGAIEMTRYALMSDHGCEPGPDGCRTTCHYRPQPRRMHPYRMDVHWIPPESIP
ncbi:hypothetical protein [Micromonospora sp. NBRC 101691]|uniref:hypothetical protein n=1 Tax=Micromonospora sp. NBRC 101691 TaxID=3032198 RepID=UPI0024A1F307|nr:hypothetical protein [Micromonospora sp. NBRC 101691]GLY21676.1 hypothetical protein Misp04_14080 [Micromonospora sp. NBRC 101691]